MKIRYALLLSLVTFIIGGYVGRTYFREINIVKVPIEKKIEVKGETEYKTQIVYVPKEVDKETGTKEKTDIEVTIPPAEINVKVNDKLVTIKPDFWEEFKFDDGKLVLDQKSSLNMDLRVPEVKRSIEFGAYATNNSLGPMVLLPRKNGSTIVGTGYDFNEKQQEYLFGWTWRF